jgi:hypothetical protein
MNLEIMEIQCNDGKNKTKKEAFRKKDNLYRKKLRDKETPQHRHNRNEKRRLNDRKTKTPEKLAKDSIRNIKNRSNWTDAKLCRKKEQKNKNYERKKSCDCHPEMNSMHIGPYEVSNDQKILRTLLIEFVETELIVKFESLFMPIVPLSNRGSNNYQSPQAIRVFFSLSEASDIEGLDLRFIYGAMAVLSSTGMHPNNFIVRPFSDLLKRILALFNKIVQKKMGKNIQLGESNFMEVKIYLGKDIFQDEHSEPLKDINDRDIKTNNNQTVGLHNDLQIDDNGKQSDNDSAMGDRPIATLNLGSTRRLQFQYFRKQANTKNAKWEVMEGCRLYHEYKLEDSSIFVLLPEDETPKLINGYLYKTKHKGIFTGIQSKGVSFGFVFRSVRTKSVFSKDDNKWVWNKDEKYKNEVENQYLESTKLIRFSRIKNTDMDLNPEVEKIIKNITTYMGNLKLVYD